MLKLAKKVEKIAEAERTKFKPELENYLASDEYKALFKNQDKIEDEEDEYKKDMDPQGYKMYDDLLNGKNNFLV